MTPLLLHLLNHLTAASVEKTEEEQWERKGAQEIQEMYYVTEQVPFTEAVWEREQVVEEHAEVWYEDVAPLDRAVVVLVETDVLSTTETQSQQDNRSEVRGELSATDTSKRKESSVAKQRISPKKPQAVVLAQDSESKLTILQDKPSKEKTEYFVKAVESPSKEITDERKDSASVSHQQDKKAIAIHEASFEPKKRAKSTETESKERRAKEKSEEPTSFKEKETLKDVTVVTKADETKPSSVVITTEARKLTENLEAETKALAEVTFKEAVDRDISVTPHEKHSNEVSEMTRALREDTVKGKEATIVPTAVKMEEKRKQEALVTPEREQSAHKVFEKKTEKKMKSEEMFYAETEIVAVKPSVTDTDVTKMIKQGLEFESVSAKTELKYKTTKETKESLSEDPLQTAPSVPLKPDEKRIPSKKSSRGTKRTVLIALLICTCVIRLHVCSLCSGVCSD